MPAGRALGLRWGDLDLEDGRVFIVQSRGAHGVSDPKTARGRRLVSLDEDTIAVLEGWREQQQAERDLWDECWTDSRGLVFTAESGHPYDPDAASASFTRVSRRLGLPSIRFHDLRHTHASLLLLAGVNPKVVSERLGHASIGLTLDTYSHLLPGLQEDAVVKLGGLLRG